MYPDHTKTSGDERSETLSILLVAVARFDIRPIIQIPTLFIPDVPARGVKLTLTVQMHCGPMARPWFQIGWDESGFPQFSGTP